MQIMVIAHNIRSTYNVGSILRTADGFGVFKVYLTGYTPYPTQKNDTRLPHLQEKITKQISKTALGAEKTMQTKHADEPTGILKRLRHDGYELVCLEQAKNSIALPQFRPKYGKVALLLGEEVNGVSSDLLKQCDHVVEIPMYGHKESFNVSVATGIALYELQKRS